MEENCLKEIASIDEKYRFYLGNERRMLCCDEAEKLEDIYRAHKLFQGLAFEDPGALDLSMGECFHCRDRKSVV